MMLPQLGDLSQALWLLPVLFSELQPLMACFPSRGCTSSGIIEISYSSSGEKYQIKKFELQILISESLVAAIYLACISYNLRKYGVRRFLFVDRYHGHKLQYRDEYILKINLSLAVPIAPLLIYFLSQAAGKIS
ncbi:unnamed protein product [Prunus armeniaca]|uniref:Uncharacterized protein n=1 Tax=Prunus armeniaca TaxID=36596 RepID=A0A6J5V3E9_PRUAR|nr:unnamed protein product [Prunus armeniaca]CAB4310950.1 unnamed protein product [Prunus armeniaca]